MAEVAGKQEVHWDFVLKEMAWLANDFKKERLRNMAVAKKVIKAVDVFHNSKESKKVKKTKVSKCSARVKLTLATYNNFCTSI